MFVPLLMFIGADKPEKFYVDIEFSRYYNEIIISCSNSSVVETAERAS